MGQLRTNAGAGLLGILEIRASDDAQLGLSGTRLVSVSALIVLLARTIGVARSVHP
ncbi:MAG: hypothetical protein ABSA26_00180 [Thermoguttaceae bacterium]